MNTPTNTTPLQQKVIEIATSYIGQKENPSNWGAFVQACLILVGITFPASWCMAFAYRCHVESAKALGLPCIVPKTGGCINAWNKAAKKIQRSKLTPNTFVPGAVYIMDHGGGLGHAFIGISCDATGCITSIEGNANNDGSRNGDGVYLLHRRHLDDKELLGCILPV